MSKQVLILIVIFFFYKTKEPTTAFNQSLLLVSVTLIKSKIRIREFIKPTTKISARYLVYDLNRYQALTFVCPYAKSELCHSFLNKVTDTTFDLQN